MNNAHTIRNMTTTFYPNNTAPKKKGNKKKKKKKTSWNSTILANIFFSWIYPSLTCIITSHLLSDLRWFCGPRSPICCLRSLAYAGAICLKIEERATFFVRPTRVRHVYTIGSTNTYTYIQERDRERERENVVCMRAGDECCVCVCVGVCVCVWVCVYIYNVHIHTHRVEDSRYSFRLIECTRSFFNFVGIQ